MESCYWDKGGIYTEEGKGVVMNLSLLELDKRTTLVWSNIRKLDRELFYKLVYLI